MLSLKQQMAFQALPPNLFFLISCRLQQATPVPGRRFASTTSTKYPFPNQRNPTPYQIFHLPDNATQTEIKSRYYELVRIHHPDVSTSSLPAAEKHKQFQAITAAYGLLKSGRASSYPSAGPGAASEAWAYAYDVARRRQAASRAQRLWDYDNVDGGGGAGASRWSATADDRWKDRMIVIIACFAIGGAIIPNFLMTSRVSQKHDEARMMLSNARREAAEVAEERAMMIRRRRLENDRAKRDEEAREKELLLREEEERKRQRLV